MSGLPPLSRPAYVIIAGRRNARIRRHKTDPARRLGRVFGIPIGFGTTRQFMPSGAFHTGSPAFRNPSKSFSRLAESAIGIKRRRYDRHFSTSSSGYSAIFWRLSVMNRCMASRAALAWPRFQSDAARQARASSNLPARRAKLLAASAKLPSKYAPTAIAKRQGSDTSGLSLRDSRE